MSTVGQICEFLAARKWKAQTMVLRPNSEEKSFAVKAQPLPRPYVREPILSSTVCIYQ